uniref:Uncharacterized protein n=1 Tax=Trypanosoma vivax (strain Y486) TaxID=1055687 RepID=G0UB42_TRYVY
MFDSHLDGSEEDIHVVPQRVQLRLGGGMCAPLAGAFADVREPFEAGELVNISSEYADCDTIKINKWLHREGNK